MQLRWGLYPHGPQIGPMEGPTTMPGTCHPPLVAPHLWGWKRRCRLPHLTVVRWKEEASARQLQHLVLAPMFLWDHRMVFRPTPFADARKMSRSHFEWWHSSLTKKLALALLVECTIKTGGLNLTPLFSGQLNNVCYTEMLWVQNIFLKDGRDHGSKWKDAEQRHFPPCRSILSLETS